MAIKEENARKEAELATVSEALEKKNEERQIIVEADLGLDQGLPEGAPLKPTFCDDKQQ